MDYDLYIFDLDGTFYDIADLISFNFNQEAAFLAEKMHITLDKAEEMLIKNGIYPVVKEDAKSCTEFFQKIGLNLSEWNKIRSCDFPVDMINKDTALSSDTLRLYKSKGKTVLVSNNTMENIKKIFSYLDISLDLFEKIISKEDQDLSGDKTNAYNKILIDFNIPAEKSVVIGDRYNIDVYPLITLGGRGVVVNGPEGVRDYLSGKNSSSFTLY